MNSRGQSLVQVIIAVGIMALIASGTASMMVNQSRENRALSEKLAALETGRSITQFLSSDVLCKTLFTPSNLSNPAELPITNAAGITPTTPYKITLKAVGTAPDNVLATQGQIVSPMSSTLAVLPNVGIDLIMTSLTSGILSVRFDQNRLVRGVANLSFHITLVTDSPANPTSITGCQGMGVAGQLKVTNLTLATNTPDYIGCPNTTVDSPAVTYQAKGNTLLVMANIQITSGDDCQVSTSLLVTGPGVNSNQRFALVGNNINGGNFGVTTGTQFSYAVQPGATYSFKVRRGTANNSAAGDAQSLTDTNLIIMDFKQ